MGLLSAPIAALPFLQWVLIITLFFIAGIAWCFILWVVPIIKLNSSRSAIAQFQETTHRGDVWLGPLSTCLAASLAITAFLLSQHPVPAEAAKWKFFATACITVAQVSWWEILMIFPLDVSIAAMKENKENFKAPEHNWLEEKSQGELLRSMDSWTKRHAVRATLPMVAGLIALSSKMSGSV